MKIKLISAPEEFRTEYPKKPFLIYAHREIGDWGLDLWEATAGMFPEEAEVTVLERRLHQFEITSTMSDQLLEMLKIKGLDTQGRPRVGWVSPYCVSPESLIRLAIGGD